MMSKVLESPDWYGEQLEKWRADFMPLVEPEFEEAKGEELYSGARQLSVRVEEDLTQELLDWIYKHEYKLFLEIRDVEIGKRVLTTWSCLTEQNPGDGTCIEYVTDKPWSLYEDRKSAGINDENYALRMRQLWLMNATSTIVCGVLAAFTKKTYQQFYSNFKWVWKRTVKEKMWRSEYSQKWLDERIGPSKFKRFMEIVRAIRIHIWDNSLMWATQTWRDKGEYMGRKKNSFWQRIAEWLSNWYYTGWTEYQEEEYHAEIAKAEQEIDHRVGQDVDLHHWHITHEKQYPCSCNACIDIEDWVEQSWELGDLSYCDWELLYVEEV
jgi:hypothetical protein